MEIYGKILNIAMPVFLALVMLEKLYGWFKFKHPFKNMDMISSMSSGYTNVVKDVLGLSVTIIGYGWFVKNFALYEIKTTWLVYVVAFVAMDFSSYWVHRIAHKVNFFWNRHVIHHSSEEFNLACALRQSVSVFVNIFTFFLIPAALVGVKPEVIGLIAPIHLFAQFWYHTTYIKDMGFLEKILVTPSHHRVHHALNPEYLDKNLAAIFIIWDKLFGTFQEELPHVPPVYGITRPASTWNPIKINFQHLWLLIQDAWRAETMQDKFLIWFKPTGWRPAGFEEKYPVQKISDPYNAQKFNPPAPIQLIVWSWFQFFSTFGLVAYLFANIASLTLPDMVCYGAFIFVSVYAYTELMDLNPNALLFEVIKAGFGFGLMYHYGNWFGMGTTSTAIVGIYLVTAVLGVGWFINRFSRNFVALD
jgi:alkylglycerol monooxygenase